MKTWCVVVMMCAVFATPAMAQDSIEVRAGGDNLDGLTGAALLKFVTEGGHGLGLRFGGSWLRERFVGGYAVFDGASLEGALTGSWHLSEHDNARFSFGTEVGARAILSSETTPAGDTSVALTTDLVPTVEVDLRHDLTLIAAMRLGVDLALDPGFELDLLEYPVELGLRWWLTNEVALKALVYVGGAFGYDGDGAKHRLGGSLGLEYAWGGRDAPDLDADPGEAPSVGAFVGMDWRVLFLGGHVSHGPGFSAGVTFFDGHLKLGVAGFARPGPMNPTTFEITPTDGQTYKGRSTIDMRSDGAVVGLMIAGALPVADWLTLELPVTVGQAGFGFYLTGEDRETPDDRRVSAWENELQDGRDASITIGIDAGLRAVFTPTALPWLRPLVGVHVTFTPGYDAYARDDYSGVSVVLGTEIGVF